MLLGQSGNNSGNGNTAKEPVYTIQPVNNGFGLTRSQLDAISRIAVWGPLSIYGAAGEPIPRWMRFFMLGAGVAQILQGVRDLGVGNNGQT